MKQNEAVFSEMSGQLFYRKIGSRYIRDKIIMEKNYIDVQKGNENMLYSNLSINESGHLCMQNQDTVELAGKYGTPLYLMDENVIRNNLRMFRSNMKHSFGNQAEVFYASKALCFKQMYRILSEENICADAVSASEIYTALHAGFDPEKILFHGSAKTRDEIQYAIRNHIGYFAVDNAEELKRISQCAVHDNIIQKILIRVTPGIDPHTFEAVKTGKVDSKFGAAIETGQALQIVEEALRMPGIKVSGIHSHIGSQIFETEPYLKEADVLAEFLARVKSECGWECSILDIGGGFPVRYTEDDPSADIPKMLQETAEHMKQSFAEKNLKMPSIWIEPGRSAVAAAGITLYSVQSIKRIPGYRNYAAVDGGMTDNPRYALYRSLYTVLQADCAETEGNEPFTIAGRCCESGDKIAENIMLKDPKPDDILAVLCTGAYNYSMASNYNRVCRAPIVLIHNGIDHLCVRRETVEDIIACDL